MSTIKVITREAYDHLAEQCEALQAKLARREALLLEIAEIKSVITESTRARIRKELSGQNEERVC